MARKTPQVTLLQSFPEGLNVAVVGASGGIGEALVRHLDAAANVATVQALTRSPGSGNGTRVRRLPLDVLDEESIRRAAELAAADAPIDVLIVASGVLHLPGPIMPEKTLRELDAEVMAHVLAINTIGPAMVAKHFLPRMRPGTKSVFAVLSARVGSISDNRLGGWYSYRASKAALNMLLKTLAIEHARRFPASIVAGLHPGTVATPLSAPFQQRVPEGKLFTPDFAAERLLAVIDGLEVSDSGSVFAWDGSRIEC